MRDSFPRPRAADLLNAQSAEFAPPPFGLIRTSHTDAQREGYRYEQRVLRRLFRQWPAGLVPGPWFRVRTPDGRSHLCQPDALILDFRARTILVVEVKLSHTIEAFWQLQRTYLPALRAAFGPRFTYAAVEICRHFVRASHPAPIWVCRDGPDAVAAEPYHSIFVGNRQWLNEWDGPEPRPDGTAGQLRPELAGILAGG
jgi:hypothetical protein